MDLGEANLWYIASMNHQQMRGSGFQDYSIEIEGPPLVVTTS